MLRALAVTGLVFTSALSLAPLAYAQEPVAKATNSIVREHMEVVGSDKVHVGTVDKYEGKSIKLTKFDPSANGKHHTIPSAWVGTLNGNTVVLNKTAKEAMTEWKTSDHPTGDAKK